MKATLSNIYKKFPEIILRTILDNIQKKGASSEEELEFLAHTKTRYPSEFARYEAKLLCSMGLFYKNIEISNIYVLFCKVFSDKLKEQFGATLTPIQANIYDGIERSRVYSFSGPTSMGKSHTLIELVKQEVNDVVIVLPSRALIAEYCKKLTASLPSDCLVLQFVEKINIDISSKRVYVITPERSLPLFSLSDDDISMIIFDEAQLTEEGIRGCRFDALVRRSAKYFSSAKLVFAHPFVSNPEVQLYKNKLLDNTCNSYNCPYNSVGKIYCLYDKDAGSFSYFSPYRKGQRRVLCNEDLLAKVLKEGGRILIYTSKNKIVKHEYGGFLTKYRTYFKPLESKEAEVMIHEVAQYLGDDTETKSLLVRLMKIGIVYHHGSMPLKVRTIVEDFITKGFGRICIATSTLTKGINMPFSLVWIESCNFQGDETTKCLELKNLLGRAGRSTTKSTFDIGFVLLNINSLDTFRKYFSRKVILSSKSQLETISPDDDNFEYVKSLNDNSLNDEYDMSSDEVSRYNTDTARICVSNIISTLCEPNGEILYKKYKSLSSKQRAECLTQFVNLYQQHLRRPLLGGEISVIRSSISIMIYYLSSRSFASIVAFRFKRAHDEATLQKACTLPDKNLQHMVPLFNDNEKLDFDLVVCDTYDYIDKVWGQAIAPVLYAAVKEYANHFCDAQAEGFANLLRYGTSSSKDIWLLRYGFSIEDLEWLSKCVTSVDEHRIVFNDMVNELSEHQIASLHQFRSVQQSS